MLKIAMTGGACAAALALAAGLDRAAEASPPSPQAAAAMAAARGGGDREFPPYEEVMRGLEKVVSTTDGAAPLYELHADKENGRLLGVLPPNYESQMLMIACTISGGDPEAGVMGPTYYAQWRRIGKQLALVAPDLLRRTDGDKTAQDSVSSLYTGAVIAALPITTMSAKGGPVIDLGMLGTKQAQSFFGPSVWGGYGPSIRAVNPGLASLTKAKAFPENIIFEYEMPNETGRLVRLTYAFGLLEGTPGFTPRRADPRVGYFYDWRQDYARTANQDVTDRYITRWHIEKADPSLALSPPKEPIVWYIEHTTPVKFRRYVREGIELWNESFEKIGIVGALEVYQQDSTTGAHMDIDPEDARYNFFRWNVSDQGYAIGPSRTNPKTGEILDADVVWHQGLTRAIRSMLESLSDDIVEQTMSPETLAFLDAHPTWDPRVRLATPERREQMIRQRALALEKSVAEPLESHEHPWTHGLNDPTNAACHIGSMLSMDISLLDAAIAADLLEGGDDAQLLDGLPEEFIGPMIRYIAAHEVGHCLGLQHNMAASSIRSLEEINSPGFEGPTAGSVMDYLAVNINHGDGEAQGPYATPTVGPYDDWAIAYGYGPEEDLEEVLSRVNEPDNIFLSQPAISIGADPRNMTWDMGADNLAFAASRLRIVRDLRERLISDIVDEGESWAEARRRWFSLLGTHVQSLFIASRWLGGSFENLSFKGDPGGVRPIEDVPADAQRRALALVIEHAFRDEAFGLTPELVRHLGKEYWFDPAGFGELVQDPSLTVHDIVGGVQAAALTFIMNPTTLRRIYDNEFRTMETEDPITLAEVLDTVSGEIWSEYERLGSERYSETNQAVSSFRRNLQREHVGRLIDLALLENATSPSLRTISTLAKRELKRIDAIAGGGGADLDAYTSAHLADVRARIAKAMEASYTIER